MNRRIVDFCFACFVIAVASFNISQGITDGHVIALVLGLFVLGWVSAGIRAQHLNEKTAVKVPASKDEDEEEKWNKMLRGEL